MNWINVDDELPAHLETVWLSNGRGWTTDYFKNYYQLSLVIVYLFLSLIYKQRCYENG